MLEREGDLERIDSTLRSVAGDEGAVLSIEGAAGVGKSALLRAAAVSAESMGFGVLRATGREIERGFAFGVVTQLFAPLLAAADDAQRDALFAGAAALARPLFGGASSAALEGEIFPRLHGLHWLCANLSSSKPVLLVVDDAHWADQPSLAFLSYLAPRIGELELCLAVAIRSAETDAGVGFAEALAREGAHALEPSPLSEPAAAALLRTHLGAGVGEELATECARFTGGNPLFLRELIRDLGGREGGAIAASEIATQVPASVDRIVLARLSAMPAEDGDVVRALAVVGDGADARLIGRLSGVEAGRIAASVDRLIEAGILDGTRLLSFEHPIVRQAIYESMPPAARSSAHLEVARALASDPEQCERAAAHMVEANPSLVRAEAAEVEALAAAARRARARGAVETAIGFLRRALVEQLDDDQRRGILLELGTDELRLGDQLSLEHLAEAERLSPDGPERAEAALAYCAALAQTGAQAKAVEVCEGALEVVGDARELRLALETHRAHASWIGGAVSDSERQPIRALEAEVAAGRTPGERGVLALLAFEAGLTANRDASVVNGLADRALAAGELLADAGAEHPNFTAAVAAKTLSCNYAEAIDQWSAGVEDSRGRGSIYGYANALFSRAYSKSLAGDMPGAEADTIEGISLLPESELITASLPLATAANVAVERGQIQPEAERALEALVARPEADAMGTVNYATLASGWLALARGELERALERFTQAGERALAAGWSGPSCMDWRSGAALALRGLDRRDEALRLVDEELELARAFTSATAAISLRAKALVVGGADGIELAREAVATASCSEARLHHAKALIDLGAALRRSGARREAREPLREGMDLADRCGSTREVERAMVELRASGARPRRPAQSGAAALSPQERQTTRLAVEGLANREIAESMFLTRRTVEMHLSSAYRKLGISSRLELADALEAVS